MLGKVTAGLGVVLLLTLAAGGIYFRYSQAQIASLNQEAAIEKARAELAEASEDYLRSTVAAQTEAITELAKQQAEIRKESLELSKLLAKHDLGELAKTKPGLVEQRVNSATAEVLRELASIE